MIDLLVVMPRSRTCVASVYQCVEMIHQIVLNVFLSIILKIRGLRNAGQLELNDIFKLSAVQGSTDTVYNV